MEFTLPDISETENKLIAEASDFFKQTPKIHFKLLASNCIYGKTKMDN